MLVIISGAPVYSGNPEYSFLLSAETFESSGSLSTPENEYSSNLYGRVITGDEGAPFVTVYLKGTSYGTSTDADGYFMLVNLPPGKHTVRVQGIGYRSAEKVVEVEDDETSELIFLIEQDVLLMEQVVVSGSRIGLLQYLPGSAAVITGSELKAIAPLTGNEVLRKVTGLHVVEEEGAGLRANIGVRGLDPDKSRNVLMLEDGIPVALGPYGEPEMYYTPSIDRMSGVEVIKGSGSILYGPQTIGGVINYITTDPPAEGKGYARISGGQGGYYSGLAGYGNTYGNTGFQVNYLRRQAENLGPTRFVLNDINGKLRFSSSPRSAATLKVGLYDEVSNSTYVGLTQTMYDTGGYDHVRLAPHDNLGVRRYSMSLSHRFSPGDNLQFNTTAYGYTTTRNWRRQDFTYDGGSSGLTGDVWGDNTLPGGMIYLRNSTGNRNRQFEVAGIENRTRYNYSLKGLRSILDAGARLHYERAYEQRINGTSATAVSGNLRDDEIRTGHALSTWLQNKAFLNDKLSVTAGIRAEMLNYERNIIRSRFEDVSVTNSTIVAELIPGAGINYNFNPRNGIFAGIHRGFAPPRIKDAISSSGQDMQLDAEKSWNIEAGARTEIENVIGFEMTLFIMDFSNQVIPVSESSGGRGTGYINAGRTRHRGAEGELILNLSRLTGMPGDFTAAFNATFIRSEFSDDRFVVERLPDGSGNDTVLTNVKGNRTPYSPVVIASGYLQYINDKGFGIRAGGRLTGSQYTDIHNTVDVGEWFSRAKDDPDYLYLQATANGRIGLIPSFFVMDLSAWYDLRGGLTFNLTIKNLLDERYIATRRPQGIRVGLPRMLNAGMALNF